MCVGEFLFPQVDIGSWISESRLAAKSIVASASPRALLYSRWIRRCLCSRPWTRSTIQRLRFYRRNAIVCYVSRSPRNFLDYSARSRSRNRSPPWIHVSPTTRSDRFLIRKQLVRLRVNMYYIVELQCDILTFALGISFFYVTRFENIISLRLETQFRWNFNG